jgi:hypothetical protein
MENQKEEIELKDEERQPCEIYSRVMGYYRSVSQWNEGKQGEFEDREYFKESKCRLDKEESK